MHELLVTGHLDGTIRVWDPGRADPLAGCGAVSNEPVWSLAAGELDGRCCVFAADGDGNVRARWIPELTPAGHPLPGHDHQVNLATGILQDRQVLVAADWERLRVWDPVGAALLNEFDIQSAVMTLVNGDGRLAAALGGWSVPDRLPGTIRVLDLATGRTRVQIPCAHDELSALAAGRAGDRLTLLSGGQGLVRRWDLRTGQQIGNRWQTYEESSCFGPPAVRAVALGELDGRPVAAAAGRWDGEVRIWDLEYGHGTGEKLHDSGEWDFPHWEETDIDWEPDDPRHDDDSISAIAFTGLAGGPALAAADGAGLLRLWDLRTRTVAGTLWAASPITAMTTACRVPKTAPTVL